MASDSKTDVDIDGETFSLVSIPNARSKMVQNVKESLSDTLDLESLLEDLNKLGKWYRVVYNGVAGYTEMQIKIQRFGYKITELMNKSAFTLLMFKKASRNVLQKLQITYQFLLDGQEQMALKTLSLSANLADKMATESKELQVDSESIIVDVKDALEQFMRERGNQERTRDQHEKTRNKYETEKEKAEAQQTFAKDEEMKAKNCYDEAQERQDKEDRLMSKALTSVAGLVSGGSGGFAARYLVVAGVAPQIGATLAAGAGAAVLANYIWNSLGQSEAKNTKKKDLEEIWKKHQNDHRDALIQLIEFTEQIKNCEDDSMLAQAAINALHHSITALKSLSVTMMKAVEFWKGMHIHCKSLAERDVLQLTEDAMKVSEEKRRDVWTSRGFKINAMHHYSQWVAFEDVCGVCTSNIKDNIRDMYAYLLENPTREQPKNNVRELAISFGSDLKITLKKNDDKNKKASGEKKKLKDVSK